MLHISTLLSNLKFVVVVNFIGSLLFFLLLTQNILVVLTGMAFVVIGTAILSPLTLFIDLRKELLTRFVHCLLTAILGSFLLLSIFSLPVVLLSPLVPFLLGIASALLGFTVLSVIKYCLLRIKGLK